MAAVELSSLQAPVAPAARDGARDFDFLLGRWRVHNRRLRQPLTGSGEWDEFDGTSIVRPLWDGRANYGEWEADAPGGRMRAVTNWIMDFTRAPERAHHSAIVELRRYVLHPGARDTLVALFERELMEPQEAAGMLLIAQYRDIDDPNTFTWLRGFPNMAARATALTTFYDGPAWARHRDAANATMVSSDDVRMLHPVSLSPHTSRTARLTVATIYTLTDEAAPGFAARFEHAIRPRLAASGMHPFALFETEHSDNTFPRLPVREHEHAFVWLAQFDELDAYDRCATALAADPRWRDDIRLALDRQLAAPPLVWRLTPTSRSPERW